MIESFNRSDLLRINVVGVSGSGKSWLSRRLGEILNVPVTEMDRLQWGPKWTAAETDTLRSRVAEVVEQDRWILDGNYHEKTHDIKWPRATLIVWVDMPFLTTIWRVLKRAVRRSWSGEELWPGTGNRETFRGTFLSFDSVVLWAMKTYWPIRRLYLPFSVSNSDSDQGPRFIRLRSQREIAELLTTIHETIEPSTRRGSEK